VRKEKKAKVFCEKALWKTKEAYICGRLGKKRWQWPRS